MYSYVILQQHSMMDAKSILLEARPPYRIHYGSPGRLYEAGGKKKNEWRRRRGKKRNGDSEKRRSVNARVAENEMISSDNNARLASAAEVAKHVSVYRRRSSSPRAASSAVTITKIDAFFFFF